MNSVDVELAKQHHHVAADEGYVEIAGTRTVGVERLAGFELVPGYGAPAENYLNAGRCRIAQYAEKLVEALRVAAKGELDHALAIFALRVGIERIVAVGLVGRHVLTATRVAPLRLHGRRRSIGPCDRPCEQSAAAERTIVERAGRTARSRAPAAHPAFCEWLAERAQLIGSTAR